MVKKPRKNIIEKNENDRILTVFFTVYFLNTVKKEVKSQKKPANKKTQIM